MRKINGTVDGRTGRYHSDMDLLLSRQLQSCDDANPEVDKGSIEARYPYVMGEQAAAP